MESAIVPGIYDPQIADENLEISTEDAHGYAKRLAREAGLLVGISSQATGRDLGLEPPPTSNLGRSNPK
jgi:cysteine synthase